MTLPMCPEFLETKIYGQYGIPTVASGPRPMAVMHGPGEHVPIANLIEACAAHTAVLGGSLGHNQAEAEEN